MEFLLPLHFLATTFMAGVIWFVQVVHYPLFARVPADAFVAYEREHCARTGWIVGPPMLLEVGTAAALLLTRAPVCADARFLAAFGLLILVWVSTAVFSVPQHRRLSQRYDAITARRLVATNWIRTAAWSGRVILLAPLVIPLASGASPSR